MYQLSCGNLDPKDCPFYDVCPSCGSRPDILGEHCPFKTSEPCGLFNLFRLHPLDPGESRWWKSLDFWVASLKAFVPDPTGSDSLRMLLHPYLDFPRRMTLPLDKVAIRTVWDNECWEYGITGHRNPPVYIPSVPLAFAFKKREAESQVALFVWYTSHSERFKSTRNALNDGQPRKPPQSFRTQAPGLSQRFHGSRPSGIAECSDVISSFRHEIRGSRASQR